MASRGRGHYSVSPDDPNVINAFLARLALQNKRTQPSASVESSSASLSGSVASSSGQTASASHSVVKIPEAVKVLPVDSRGVDQNSPPEMEPTDKKVKGLGDSKWSHQVDSDQFQGPTSHLSPGARHFIPSSSRSSGELADMTNEHTAHGDWQPGSARNKPTQHSRKSQSEQPAPDSIFAGRTEKEAQRMRQETLDRKIQETQEAKERIRKQFIEQTQAATAQRALSDNEREKTLQASIHAPTGSKPNSIPAEDSEATMTPGTATWNSLLSKARAAPSPLQTSYTPNELLSVTSPYKDPGNLTPAFNRHVATEVSSNSDVAVQSLLEKLNFFNATSPAGYSSKESAKSAVDDSFTPSAPRSPLPQIPPFPTKQAPKILADEAKDLPDQEIKSKRATVAEWQKFAQTEQGRDEASAEDKLFFKSYPKPEKREDGPPLPRKMTLHNLPVTSTTKSIASMIFGGGLEEIRYTKGSNTASVTFLNPGEAAFFFDETANGIVCSGDGLRIVWVEMDTKPLPQTGIVKQHMANGVTRCVRIIGIEKDMTVVERLGTLAKGEKGDREIESITAKQLLSGHYGLEIRFCSFKDAYAFFSSLRHDQDWEHCNIQYAPDPCAERKGAEK